MPMTQLADAADQIQKYWSPLFMKQLRESLLLGALVNKDYQGEIKALGDTVRVSQINAPAGSLKTVGVDADVFDSNLVVTTKIDIKADKRATAAFEIHDLVDLQSQIGAQSSELRDSLMFSVEKQINDYLYTLVAPSVAAPDHLITAVSDFNATQLNFARMLASQAKWMKEKGWWALIDPSYYSDILNAQTLVSADFVGDDKPVVGGQVVNQRFGFNMLEDNSAGLATLSAGGGVDAALLFHPDFLHLVMQAQPQFKLSDLHSNKKFGYLLSVDVVFGAKLGIDGAKKHIVYKNV